ncbi:MAG: alpha-glucosidase [Mogibacterium sp.]|nr:alpha-glucosidase [Mogibacterium sp.]
MLSEKYKEFTKWVIYQIYPRSFMDSNGDGIGDLQGVISKLDYIKELGANAVWLCPCFKSPNEDTGYDVADSCNIMDEFGTMEDMDQLIGGLHKRGMKLILDLVPNHTSTDHKWFQESRKGKDNPYSDYYYWFDAPPNDWESSFGGSAWQYDEMRGQYYLHTFAVGQADLNWENPAVVKAMQDVVDFWVDKGCDGFRIDVIDCISKDLPNGQDRLGPRIHEYIRALFGREKTAHLFTVGEGSTNDIDDIVLHCASGRDELSTLFIFEHMECGRTDKFTPEEGGMRALRDCLVYWQNETAKRDLLYSLFIENHDQPQMISRIGNDRDLRYESATDIAAMVYLLKGVPFIYQGQEIGMPAAHYDSIDDFDDVESLGAYRKYRETLSEEETLEKINFGSRDNGRHPMAWDGSKNSGFTEGDCEPWLINHSRAKEVNVENDLNSERSVRRFYQELLRLRAGSNAFLEGDFEVLSSQEDDFFIYTRAAGGEKWVVVCNFEKEQVIDLPFGCEKPALSNLGRKTADGRYLPYECAAAKCLLKMYLN